MPPLLPPAFPATGIVSVFSIVFFPCLWDGGQKQDDGRGGPQWAAGVQQESQTATVAGMALMFHRAVSQKFFMIRKKISLAGAVIGLFYAFIGVAGAYYDPSLTGTPGRLAVEFLVISAFTTPLGGMIGLGFGLLIEALVQTFFKRQPETVRRQDERTELELRARQAHLNDR